MNFFFILSLKCFTTSLSNIFVSLFELNYEFFRRSIEIDDSKYSKNIGLFVIANQRDFWGLHHDKKLKGGTTDSYETILTFIGHCEKGKRFFTEKVHKIIITYAT